MIVLVDAVLAVLILEAVALVLFYRQTGRGIPPGALLPMLSAGLCLVLALRLALTGAGLLALALCLALAGLAHLADIVMRWPSKR